MAALCTLLNSTGGESSLIFGKTKYGVEKLGKQLSNLGFAVGTLHGNKSQRAREEVLAAFRHGRVQTLLATNVAARGLDIQGIYQVINYELPESSELFTHRIGRTGRMGRQGKAITLLTPSDVSKWRRMSRNLGQAVSLKQLTIADDAMVAKPLPQPVIVAAPESEQRLGSRPARTRKYASSTPTYDRSARPDAEDNAPAETKQRTKKIRVNTAPTWQSEEFVRPERFVANKERHGKRTAGQSARFGRNKVKHNAYASFETEAQYHGDDKKSGARASGRARRRAVSTGRSNHR
ncbi:helicase-related protein [Dictyobacter formicarum]